ncbi:MAG TPA: hypothetical protein VLT59_11485 [Steroidobacteraceae bacterium]|nr:hypothetical protein [Steroidobacteraceae bacterium]
MPTASERTADTPVTLFVGTDKGLFRLHSERERRAWRIDGPHLPGYRILDLCQAPDAPAELYVAVEHDVWGAHVYRSDDAGDHWGSLATVPHHPPGRHRRAIKAIWSLAFTPDGSRLYAGIDPVGLFVSSDRGAAWSDIVALNEHATRDCWEPSKGIFAVHSICVDASDPRRLVVAISAGGVYRSEDGGETWAPANAGVRAENLPNRYPVAGHNVHRVVMHPTLTQRLYRQCYNGTYRSDDGARQWVEITAGLPSDFGYAIATDPNDPDTVFQIPESGAELRTTVDGKLRVFRSRDGGRHWESASSGLPAGHAWITVLREAVDVDRCSPCGVYFGTSSGHLFATRDAGDSWQLIAEYLPRILSVTALGGGT